MDWKEYGIEERFSNIDTETMEECNEAFERVEEIRDYNQIKVLNAFREVGVGTHHLLGSYGYGYGDIGRDTLDSLFAMIVGAEDALCRTQFMSGTHAIVTALFGILRSGMKLLSVCGTPYDTIHTTLGFNGSGLGSLQEYGIIYDQIDLVNGKVNLKLLKEKVKGFDVVYIQRSSGYTLRDALSLEEIKEISTTAKSVEEDIIVVVDNCYGEFTRKSEPTSSGADLIIGSLIKNPGGGIAETGGYIAGRKDLVELTANRLTAPGVGREIGSNPLGYRNTYLGLYMATSVTAEALKSAIYASCFFKKLGFETSPSFGSIRNDIITIVKMETKENLEVLCRAIQSSSPIDSFAVPTATDMPGYDSKVIMASGSFTAGSSIELSSDAPMKEPYYAFIQGGLSFIASRYAFLKAATLLKKDR